MLSSNALPIAIEFGVSALKVLQLTAGDPPTLIAGACLDTPEELRSDHDKRLTFQCEHLGKLLKSGRFKGKRAICSIPASCTLVQHLQIQKSDGTPATSQILDQLQSQIQCDPSRVVVRHIEVDGVQSAGASRSEVICFAVARDLVMRIMNAMRGAKYEVIGMHSEHVALARAFDRVTRRDSDRDFTSLYLDLGAGATKIVLTCGRDIVFAKTIQVAGIDLDRAVSKVVGCDLREARARRLAMGRDRSSAQTTVKIEAVRCRVGAADRTDDRPANAASESSVNMGSASDEERRVGSPTPGFTGSVAAGDLGNLDAPLQAPTNELVSEISMCLRYHERLFPDRSVGRAVFVGGEARELMLCQRIAKLLRLPAQVADPLACVRKTGNEPMRSVDLLAPQPGWAAVFGLCYAPKNL